jgi:hypothetical protein
MIREVMALSEEIDVSEPYLSGLSREQRTAQVCVFAGRAKALEARLGPQTADEQEANRGARVTLRRIFGRLTRIARELNCGWIDALSPDWTTDWPVYIERHQAIASGRDAQLSEEHEFAYQRAVLQGLLNSKRRALPPEVSDTLADALEILPGDDPLVEEAIKRFGRPPERHGSQLPRHRDEDAEDEPAPETYEVPAEVLLATEGRKVLMVGGQGARAGHQTAIQSTLRLSALEWVISERGKASGFLRAAAKIRPSSYDFVLFLASHASHASSAIVQACKRSEVPLVYLSRGYSVASIVRAIQEQLSRSPSETLPAPARVDAALPGNGE